MRDQRQIPLELHCGPFIEVAAEDLPPGARPARSRTAGSALARACDPATAHRAARSVDGQAIADLVVSYLREAGPRTTEQLAAEMGLSLVTVSPRLAPLARAGRVRRAGEAANASGRMAILWAAT